MPNKKKVLRYLPLFASFLVFFVFIYIKYLQKDNPTGEEIWSLTLINKCSFFDLFLSKSCFDIGNPPLHFAYLKLFLLIFSQSDLAILGSSLPLSILSIYLFHKYLLQQKKPSFYRFISLAVLATNNIFTYASMTARPYGLLFLLCQTTLLISLQQKKLSNKFFIIALLGFLTHFTYFIFYILVILAWYLKTKNLKNLLVPTILLLLVSSIFLFHFQWYKIPTEYSFWQQNIPAMNSLNVLQKIIPIYSIRWKSLFLANLSIFFTYIYLLFISLRKRTFINNIFIFTMFIFNIHYIKSTLTMAYYLTFTLPIFFIFISSNLYKYKIFAIIFCLLYFYSQTRSLNKVHSPYPLVSNRKIALEIQQSNEPLLAIFSPNPSKKGDVEYYLTKKVTIPSDSTEYENELKNAYSKYETVYLLNYYNTGVLVTEENKLINYHKTEDKIIGISRLSKFVKNQ